MGMMGLLQMVVMLGEHVQMLALDYGVLLCCMD